MSDKPKDAKPINFGTGSLMQPNKLLLVDPLAVAVAGVVARMNFFEQNADATARLVARAKEKSVGEEKFVVVLIDVDDTDWCVLADTLMPGYDWDQYRKRNEKPVARGVVPRSLITDIAKHVTSAPPVPPGVFTAVFASRGITFVEAL